jgi:uncharacterized membrane protein
MNLFHTIVSIVAMISGGIIFFYTKGTSLHRKIGYTYVISMLLCLLTSFFIYDMFGGFGPFHILSIVSLVTISIGIFFPVWGRSVNGWQIHHYFWMSYSYVGLWMAFMSHFMHLFPTRWPNFIVAFVAWGLPYILGSVVIFAQKNRMIHLYTSDGKTTETQVG